MSLKENRATKNQKTFVMPPLIPLSNPSKAGGIILQSTCLFLTLSRWDQGAKSHCPTELLEKLHFLHPHFSQIEIEDISSMYTDTQPPCASTNCSGPELCCVHLPNVCKKNEWMDKEMISLWERSCKTIKSSFPLADLPGRLKLKSQGEGRVFANAKMDYPQIPQSEHFRDNVVLAVISNIQLIFWNATQECNHRNPEIILSWAKASA